MINPSDHWDQAFERTIISKEKGACRCRDVHTCDSYNKWNLIIKWLIINHEISRWIERLNSRMTARFAGFHEWAFHSRNAVPKSCQPKCQKVARKKLVRKKIFPSDSDRQRPISEAKMKTKDPKRPYIWYSRIFKVIIFLPL